MKKYLVVLEDTESLEDTVTSDSLARAKQYAEELLLDKPAGTVAFIYQHCLHAVKAGVVYSRSSPNSATSGARVKKKINMPSGITRKRWTGADKDALRKMFFDGHATNVIADKLERTELAISHQITRMKLVR